MTIDKLPSGNYRVRQTKNGKNFSVIFDHKPTKREAEDALFDKMLHAGERPNGAITFQNASDLYCDMKKNVLSPSTIREYSKMCSRMSEWFVSMKIDDIDQVAINKQINDLSARLSPKSVRNYHSYISAILGTFRPQMRIYTTLPQKRKMEPYTPSDEDIRRIVTELKGTPYYLPIILACYGMRRGEVLALTPDDVEENGIVHINKAAVIDSNKNMVIKSTKTTESERDILIDKKFAEMIHTQGFVYNKKPGGINEALTKAQKKLGIPHFPLHMIRHYFVAKMLTITDETTVQKLGGWKGNSVMRKVYAYSMKAEQEKAKRLAVDKFSKSIF